MKNAKLLLFLSAVVVWSPILPAHVYGADSPLKVSSLPIDFVRPADSAWTVKLGREDMKGGFQIKEGIAELWYLENNSGRDYVSADCRLEVKLQPGKFYILQIRVMCGYGSHLIVKGNIDGVWKDLTTQDRLWKRGEALRAQGKKWVILKLPVFNIGEKLLGMRLISHEPNWPIFIRGVEGERVGVFFDSIELVEAKRTEVPTGTLKYTTGHPRLFFTKSDIPQLRQKAAAPGQGQWAWERVKKKADSCLDKKLPEVDYSKHHAYMGISREWARRALEPLTLAYHITGEEKYAAKAKEILLGIADHPRWAGDEWLQKGYVAGYWPVLETGEACIGVATAYDLLYNYLTESERKIVRRALVEKGIKPIMEYWVDPGTRLQNPVGNGNWYSVVSSGAGVAALTLLGEEPEAERWVVLTRDAMLEWLKDTKEFGRDGGYIEGLTYYEYALSHFLPFANAMKRITGDDSLIRSLNKKLPDFMLYMSYLTKEGSALVTFEDAHPFRMYLEIYAGLAAACQNPYLQWLNNELFKPGYEEGLIYEGSIHNEHFLLSYDPDLKPRAPDDLPHSRVFGDVGWAVFRSGWGRKETLLAIKCGHAGYGHVHLNAGNFVLFAGGQPLILDVGYGMRGTADHNTFLIEKHGQLIGQRPEVNPKGNLLDFIQTDGYGYVLADASNLYRDTLKKFHRHVLWLEPDCFVMIDDIEALEPSVYHWQINCSPGVKVDESTSTFDINKNDASLTVRMLHPKAVSLKVKRNIKSRFDEFYVDRLKVTTTESASKATFLTVFHPYSKGNNRPEILDIAKDDYLGARINRKTGTDIILYRCAGVDIQTDKIRTDGAICVVSTKDDELTRVVMHKGTNLEFNGKVVFSSTEESSIAMGPAAAVTDTSLIKTKVAMVLGRDAQIKIHCPGKVEKVTVDGKLVTNYSHDPKESLLSLRLKAGYHTLEILQAPEKAP